MASDPARYELSDYAAMVADRARMDAYARALEAAVKPGSVVLDIGSGTGMFALLACRLGARKVYAIETGDIVQVARDMARANGFGDRVDFIQSSSLAVELPERVDVVVSDLRGVLPLYQAHLAIVADARARFLAPGGVLIPARDTIRAAVLESSAAYAELVSPWDAARYGIDLGAALSFATNTWGAVRKRHEAQDLIAPPAIWATLDYATVEAPDVAGDLAWAIERQATGHGLLAWFDSELGPGIGYWSFAPGGASVYGQAYFPWPEPVDLAPGDTVRVSLRADLVADDYVWRWDTRIAAGDAAGGKVTAFSQSDFAARPLALDQLAKRAATHRPTLNEDGRVARLIISMMDGGATLAEIATRVREDHPRRFPNHADALAAVGEMSLRYS